MATFEVRHSDGGSSIDVTAEKFFVANDFVWFVKAEGAYDGVKHPLKVVYSSPIDKIFSIIQVDVNVEDDNGDNRSIHVA